MVCVWFFDIIFYLSFDDIWLIIDIVVMGVGWVLFVCYDVRGLKGFGDSVGCVDGIFCCNSGFFLVLI